MLVYQSIIVLTENYQIQKESEISVTEIDKKIFSKEKVIATFQKASDSQIDLATNEETTEPTTDPTTTEDTTTTTEKPTEPPSDPTTRTPTDSSTVPATTDTTNTTKSPTDSPTDNSTPNSPTTMKSSTTTPEPADDGVSGSYVFCFMMLGMSTGVLIMTGCYILYKMM